MDSLQNAVNFNCALCTNLFKQTGYASFGFGTPRLLQCGHSACEKCLEGMLIAKDGLMCKICKTVVMVPAHFDRQCLTDIFPINYFLTGLWFTSNKANDPDSLIKYSIPKHAKKKRNTEVICHECMLIVADSYCNECNEPYCGQCFKLVHSVARALKKHNKVPLLSINQHIVDIPFLCDAHKDKKVEFYCKDCNVSFCSHCLFQLHKDHTYILLDNMITNLKTEFIERYTKVTNMLGRLNFSKKKVEESIQSNINMNYKLHQQIIEHYAQLHGKLIVHENNMHLKLNMTDTKKHLMHLLEILTEAVNDTQALLSSSSILLKSSSSPTANTFISVIDDLKEKEDMACHFLETEVATEPRVTVDVDLMKKLEDICTLELTSGNTYTLVKESDLPIDYQTLPIEEVTSEEIIEKIQALSLDAVPVDGQSDQVPDGASSTSSSDSSRTSVPSDKYDSIVFPDELPIGCNIRVRISHLISPSEFYVQREGSFKNLSDFQKTINSNKISQQTPPSSIVKGRFYLAFYEPDKLWYRARILEILKEGEYRVLYIDYGNSEIINLKKLRTFPKSTFKFPILAYCCKLNNCVPRCGDEWDPAAVAFMAELIDNGSVFMHVVNKSVLSYVVDLYRSTASQLINVQQALSFQEYSSYVPRNQVVPKELSERSNQPMLTYLKIKKGEIFDVHVCFVISPNNFFVQNIKWAKRLLRLSEEMQNTYNVSNLRSNLIYDPVKGTLVAACYSKDRKWYRGIINNRVDGKQLHVSFIDIGIDELVDWNNVKLLQNRFCSLPVQAINCSLSDIEPVDTENGWSADTKSFFVKLIHNLRAKIVISSVTTNGNVNVVLYQSNEDTDICINALLVREKFATSTGINSTIVEYKKYLPEQPGEDFQCQIGVAKSREPTSPPDDIQKIETPNSVTSGYVKCEDGTFRINVIVKRIVNPGEFYVMPSYMKNVFNQLETSMQKHYADSNESLEEEWKIDDRCVVQLNGTWHRAIVLEILPEETSNLKLNLPDEGMELVVNKSSIRPLHKDFSTLNDGVTRCHLGGLVPPLNKWAHSSTSEFDYFVKKHSDALFICKLGEIKEESLPVQLFAQVTKVAGPLEPNRSEWISLNHYLRLIGQAKSDNMVQWDCEGNILNWNDLGCNKENLDETILGMFSSPLNISNKVHTAYASTFEYLTDLPEDASTPKSWIPAPPLKNLSFICTPTYVDIDCNIYLYNFHDSTPVLAEISNVLGIKLENSPPKPYDSRIKVGDICIAKYHLDNKWYRAILLEIKEDFDEYIIQFVDYGNVEECKLSELRAVTITHNIPIQTVKCCFYTIIPATPDGKWPQNIIESIQSTIVDKHCQICLCVLPNTDVYGIKELILPDGTNLIVELINQRYARYKNEIVLNVSDFIDHDSTLDSDILMPIIPIINTKKEIPTPEKEVCQMKPEIINNTFFHWTNIIKDIPEEFQPTLQYHELQIPDTVNAIFVEATAFFSPTNLVLHLANVQEDSNIITKIEEFKELSKTLQDEGPLQPPITKPYIGKACCAKFSGDGHWYRAFILSEPSNEEEMRVQFVDYGNVESIPISCIRSLKEEWAKLEVFGLFSQLYNISVSKKIKDLNVVTEILSSQGPYRAIIKERSPCLQVDLYINDVLAYKDLIDSGLIIQSKIYNSSSL